MLAGQTVGGNLAADVHRQQDVEHLLRGGSEGAEWAANKVGELGVAHGDAEPYTGGGPKQNQDGGGGDGGQGVKASAMPALGMSLEEARRARRRTVTMSIDFALRDATFTAAGHVRRAARLLSSLRPDDTPLLNSSKLADAQSEIRAAQSSIPAGHPLKGDVDNAVTAISNCSGYPIDGLDKTIDNLADRILTLDPDFDGDNDLTGEEEPHPEAGNVFDSEQEPDNARDGLYMGDGPIVDLGASQFECPYCSTPHSGAGLKTAGNRTYGQATCSGCGRKLMKPFKLSRGAVHAAEEISTPDFKDEPSDATPSDVDARRSPAHVVHSIAHHLSHAVRHVQEAQTSKGQSTKFNVDHALRHLGKAHADVKKLSSKLRETDHDPKLFGDELDRVQELSSGLDEDMELGFYLAEGSTKSDLELDDNEYVGHSKGTKECSHCGNINRTQEPACVSCGHAFDGSEYVGGKDFGEDGGLDMAAIGWTDEAREAAREARERNKAAGRNVVHGDRWGGARGTVAALPTGTNVNVAKGEGEYFEHGTQRHNILRLPGGQYRDLSGYGSDNYDLDAPYQFKVGDTVHAHHDQLGGNLTDMGATVVGIRHPDGSTEGDVPDKKIPHWVLK